MDTETTYQREYRRWPVQPERAISARAAVRPVTPQAFEGNSTYRDHYPWRPHTPSLRVKEKGAWWEPIEAAVPYESTYSNAYKGAKGNFAAQSFKPKGERVAPTPFVGESTYNAMFKALPFARTPSARAVERPSEHVPFDGKSTYAESFRPPGAQTRVIGRKPADERQQPPTRFEGTSHYRDMYKDIRLPPGMQQELGVQVVGGRFYHMIKQGARPPCEGRATFTTVVDMQETAEIVVVGRKHEARGRFTDTQLAHFELGGIVPNSIGMAQIIVTYKLNDDFTLRVTALDKQRNHSRQITCRQLR